MSKEVISIGNKITLKQLKKGNSLVEQENYTSQFLQWVDHNTIQVSAPIFKGHLIPLNMADEYLLIFYTNRGLYQCKATVVERTKQGNLAVANMRLVSEFEKYQRRQFYRMECILPLFYSVLTERQKKLYVDLKNCLGEERKNLIKEQIELEEIKSNQGTILDISGGGIRFNSDIILKPNDCLLLKPSLGALMEKKLPFLFGRVISSTPLKNRETVFDNRIEFTDIRNSERENIITYIFKEEREKRRHEVEM